MRWKLLQEPGVHERIVQADIAMRKGIGPRHAAQSSMSNASPHKRHGLRHEAANTHQARIPLTERDRDEALAIRDLQCIQRNPLRNTILQAQSIQRRACDDDGIIVTRIQLRQPGLNRASDGDVFRIWK